jgi:prepilin-type N-terminal cleavage/methylation domain-containing protein
MTSLTSPGNSNMPITTRTSANRNARSRGFTLIELLAVMAILAILMTLVVGATTLIYNRVNINETKSTMKILMVAVREYQKAKAKDDAAGGNNYADLNDGNWVGELASKPESRKLIEKLPQKVWSDDKENEFHDAWGAKIEFDPSGGLAGAPGLKSGGRDEEIGTDDDVRYNK